jgi:hypothetical protein
LNTDNIHREFLQFRTQAFSGVLVSVHEAETALMQRQMCAQFPTDTAAGTSDENALRFEVHKSIFLFRFSATRCRIRALESNGHQR